MEVNNLPTIILVFVAVGMLIGVGILTFTSFGNAAGVSTTVSSENITWLGLNENITLAHGNLTSFTQILNSSGDVLSTSNYSVTNAAGRIQVLDNTTGACATGTDCIASYVYTEYDTDVATATTHVSTAIGTIPTTWLPLIIVIVCLAIIMIMVIRSFGGMKGR